MEKKKDKVDVKDEQVIEEENAVPSPPESGPKKPTRASGWTKEEMQGEEGHEIHTTGRAGDYDLPRDEEVEPAPEEKDKNR